jgi:hypothetical protein
LTDDFNVFLQKISNALQKIVPETDMQRRRQVVSSLAEIQGTEKKAVVQEARKIYEQQSWNITGDVYQAGRDIHITLPAKKSLLEKWQTWAAFLAATLTALSLVIDLPAKFSCAGSPFSEGARYRGIVVELVGNKEEKGVPAAEIEIKSASDASSILGTGLTQANGEFSILVKAQYGTTVWVRVQKPGYQKFAGMKNLAGNDKVILRKKG